MPFTGNRKVYEAWVGGVDLSPPFGGNPSTIAEVVRTMDWVAILKPQAKGNVTRALKELERYPVNLLPAKNGNNHELRLFVVNGELTEARFRDWSNGREPPAQPGGTAPVFSEYPDSVNGTALYTEDVFTYLEQKHRFSEIIEEQNRINAEVDKIWDDDTLTRQESKERVAELRRQTNENDTFDPIAYKRDLYSLIGVGGEGPLASSFTLSRKTALGDNFIVQQTFDEAKAFINSIASRLTGDRLADAEIQVERSKRAHWKDLSSTIGLTENISLSTMVHELGHGVEHRSSGRGQVSIRAWSERFLKRRARKARIVRLSKATGLNYDADEFTLANRVDGEFVPILRPSIDDVSANFYVTKIYAVGGFRLTTKPKDLNIRATELITIGLEGLLNSPHTLAHSDPEYFKWLIGVLNGDYVDQRIINAALKERAEQENENGEN